MTAPALLADVDRFDWLNTERPTQPRAEDRAAALGALWASLLAAESALLDMQGVLLLAADVGPLPAPLRDKLNALANVVGPVVSVAVDARDLIDRLTPR